MVRDAALAKNSPVPKGSDAIGPLPRRSSSNMPGMSFLLASNSGPMALGPNTSLIPRQPLTCGDRYGSRSRSCRNPYRHATIDHSAVWRAEKRIRDLSEGREIPGCGRSVGRVSGTKHIQGSKRCMATHWFERHTAVERFPYHVPRTRVSQQRTLVSRKNLRSRRPVPQRPGVTLQFTFHLSWEFDVVNHPIRQISGFFVCRGGLHTFDPCDYTPV